MYEGQIIFSQLIEFLPHHEFRKCVERYQGNYYVKSFSCWDQFLCMAFPSGRRDRCSANVS